VPCGIARVDRERERQVEVGDRGPELVGVGGERETWRVDPDHRQPEGPVALGPGLQIRQGADAGDMGDVNEVDDHRSTGAEPLHGRRLGADPGGVRRKRGNGDVLCLGSHDAGILMLSAVCN
jgi:hypothetical protein